MKKYIAACLLLAGLSSAVFAGDDKRITVVELFTSQGCSSCPPADAALKKLRKDPNLLTLSWAVDYWDRLGWKDTFSSRAATKRQSAYNTRFKRRSNYTPQMVFDGRTEGVGSRKLAVMMGLGKARLVQRPHHTPALSLADGKVAVSLTDDTSIKDVKVRAVWYLADAEVEIGSGENRNRILEYTNIVLASKIVGSWDGNAKNLRLDTKKARKLGADHIAVLLHSDNGHGPIMGAAKLAL